MTNTFEFNSRETYLAYRTDWKTRYKARSEEIRATKKLIKSAYELGQQSVASNLQRKLGSMRYWANQLMLELSEAKEFKNTQLAALQPVAA